MDEYSRKPESPAEKIIGDVFNGLAQAHGADLPVARQRLSNRLREATRPRRVSQTSLGRGYQYALIMVLLALLASWAGNIQIPGWDDGQQITILLPRDFQPDAYPHWVALFANSADDLADRGGHSLVVDYRPVDGGRYFLQLNLLGVDYSQANDWLRSSLSRIPELSGTPYSIQQPLVPFSVSVKDMLAYQLGDTDGVERSVLRAWTAEGQRLSEHCYLFLVARPHEDPRQPLAE
jgi:hypothetical protein